MKVHMQLMVAGIAIQNCCGGNALANAKLCRELQMLSAIVPVVQCGDASWSGACIECGIGLEVVDVSFESGAGIQLKMPRHRRHLVSIARKQKILKLSDRGDPRM